MHIAVFSHDTFIFRKITVGRYSPRVLFPFKRISLSLQLHYGSGGRQPNRQADFVGSSARVKTVAHPDPTFFFTNFGQFFNKKML